MDKKWLIGCGGCLGVVLVLVIAGAGLLWWGGSTFMEGSQKTAETVFGDRLPPDYMTVFGMPIPSKDGEIKMVFLMHPQTQQVLFAMDSPLPEEQRDMILSGNSENVETLIQQAMASSNSSNVESMELMRTTPLRTPAGSVMALEFRMQSDEGYTPLVVGLIPIQGDRMKILMLMDPATVSRNPDADFSSEFDQMASEMESVIAQSSVAADAIPVGQAG